MLYTQYADKKANLVTNAFAVSLGVDFTTYLEMLNYNLQDDSFGAAGSPALPQAVQQMLAEGPSDQSAVPVFFSRNKCRDTSLGGNDAINCFYSYNENDDVTHPFLQTPFGNTAMGRIASENDDNQQILYITFGVPQFNSVASFYKGAIDSQLAALMNSGSSSSAQSIGAIVGLAVGTFITLPALPLAFLVKFVQSLGSISITKYYDFTSAMPLYYSIVNSMIVHLAVNMNLANDSLALGQRPASGSTSSIASAQEQALSANVQGGDTSGLPDPFRTFGFDIYRILCKKYLYEKGAAQVSTLQSTDQAIQAGQSTVNVDPDAANSTFLSTFITAFTGALTDASLYIGFKVENTLDTSESVTNVTGESNIAQTLNSRIEQSREFKFNTMGGNITQGIGAVLSGIGSVVTGAADAFGVGALTEIMKGDALIDIPEVWKNSSFNKSYNFRFQLRSPYGDPISIMQSIYIPLCMLLAGALPRAAGASSYTSPFICRAYCKGMVAMPLAMIDSIHIARGVGQHGWNNQRLPTAVDVSISIKDLSPTMYLAIAASGGSIFDVFGTNSSFQEYLMTLSGMGLAERLRWFMNLKRKAKIFLTMLSTTKLSGAYWGTNLGGSLAGRLISSVVPSTGLPTN